MDSPILPRELDYEEQREQNIVRNRALLASLGPMPELLPADSKRTKKRGKATAKTSREVVANTDTPSTRSATRAATVAGAPPQQDVPELSDKARDPDVIMGTETPAAPSNAATAAIVTVTSTPLQQDTSGPSDKVSSDVVSMEPSGALGAALTVTGTGARPPPTQDALQEQSDKLSTSSTPPAVETPPSNISGSSVTDAHSPALPGWMDDALRYFRLVEGGERWTQLVTEWQALEAYLGYPDGQV